MSNGYFNCGSLAWHFLFVVAEIRQFVSWKCSKNILFFFYLNFIPFFRHPSTSNEWYFCLVSHVHESTRLCEMLIAKMHTLGRFDMYIYINVQSLTYERLTICVNITKTQCMIHTGTQISNKDISLSLLSCKNWNALDTLYTYFYLSYYLLTITACNVLESCVFVCICMLRCARIYEQFLHSFEISTEKND